jgi:hypothetical protein
MMAECASNRVHPGGTECLVWEDDGHRIRCFDRANPNFKKKQANCRRWMREEMNAMDEKFTRDEPVFTEDGNLLMKVDGEHNQKTWALWNFTLEACVK